MRQNYQSSSLVCVRAIPKSPPHSITFSANTPFPSSKPSKPRDASPANSYTYSTAASVSSGTSPAINSSLTLTSSSRSATTQPSMTHPCGTLQANSTSCTWMPKPAIGALATNLVSSSLAQSKKQSFN